MQYSHGEYIIRQRNVPCHRSGYFKHNIGTPAKYAEKREWRKNTDRNKNHTYLANSGGKQKINMKKVKQTNERKAKKEDKAKGEPMLRRRGTAHHRGGAKRAETWRGWVK